MKRKLDKLEKELMNCKKNLNTAREIHDGLVDSLVQIVGKDHDAAKRLIESSNRFWNSLDKEGGL